MMVMVSITINDSHAVIVAIVFKRSKVVGVDIDWGNELASSESSTSAKSKRTGSQSTSENIDEALGPIQKVLIVEANIVLLLMTERERERARQLLRTCRRFDECVACGPIPYEY